MSGLPRTVAQESEATVLNAGLVVDSTVRPGAICHIAVTHALILHRPHTGLPAVSWLFGFGTVTVVCIACLSEEQVELSCAACHRYITCMNTLVLAVLCF